MFTTGIIVAAGNASRMQGVNKIFYELCGTPVIGYSIEAFEKAQLINEIVIVAKEDDFERIRGICESLHVNKPVKLAPGGDTRSRSVQNGIRLSSTQSDFIAIHDGARPLITAELADRLVSLAYEYGCVAPCTPVIDTIKTVDDDMTVQNTPDRKYLKAVQTPQVFKKEILLKAYDNAGGFDGYDDCSYAERIGERVHLFELAEHNMKITRKDDLVLAELYTNFKK